MAVKLIFIDIDGTLTNDKKEITSATKQALMTAQQYGIRLVIASGRPSHGIFQYGDQLDMRLHHGVFICYNGARVVNCEDGKVMMDITIPEDLTTAVLNHLKKFDVIPLITHGSHMVVEDVYNCMVKDGDHEFNVLAYESRNNGYQLMETKDLASYAKFPCNKILTAGDSDYLQAHYEEMSEPFKGKLNMMFTSNFYYEYTAFGVDKGTAAKEVMKQLNVKPEECIAFGDSENDIPMLKLAGLGIAMGNAQPDVIKAADEVTLDNNHDGIAESLYKHLEQLHTYE